MTGITLECLSTWSDDVTSTSYVIARHRHANVVDCFVSNNLLIFICKIRYLFIITLPTLYRRGVFTCVG